MESPVAQPADAVGPAPPRAASSLIDATNRFVASPYAIVALTILAFVVAAYDVGGKSLWLDEAASVNYTSSLSTLGNVISGGKQGYPNMGLYYVLLYFWQQIFGSGEIALRSLSVLLGGLSVPVMVLLGTRLFGRPTGLLSGLLLALSPFFVQWEQTARAYALLILLILLSSYFFVRQLEQPSRATLIGYVLASALSFWAHYFAAFFLLVQALTVLAVKRRAALTREWLTAAGAIALLCAPEVVFASRRPGVDWVPVPNFGDLIDLPSALAGGRVLLVALLILACYAVLCAIDDRDPWRAGYVAAWFLVPVLLVFAISKLGRPLFIDRFLIIALPALLLLAAAGLVRLPGRALGIVALGLLVAASAVGIRDWYTRPSVEDYRAATRYILENERPGDKVIYDPSYISDPFGYYEARAGRTGPSEFEPSEFTLGTRPPRIWVVERYGDPPEAITQPLAGAYAPAATTSSSFPNPVVTLYQEKSSPPQTQSSASAVGPNGVAGAAAALSHANLQPSALPAGWVLVPPPNDSLAQHMFVCLHLLHPNQPRTASSLAGPGELKITSEILGWSSVTEARSATAVFAQGSSDAKGCVESSLHFATTDFSVQGPGDAGVIATRRPVGAARAGTKASGRRPPAAAAKATIVYALSYHGPSGPARGALVVTARGSATAVTLAYRKGEQALPAKLLPALATSAYQRLGEATVAPAP
jgi:mannosyltransferase